MREGTLRALAALCVVVPVLAIRAGTDSIAADPQYISTMAGSGVAGFNGDGLPPKSTAFYLPQDGIFGPDGNYYFSDWNNHRIRRIRNDVVESVAGTGEIGDAPDGPALSIKLNHPTHISFDSQGRMLLSAWHNSKLKRVDLVTGMATNIAGTGARAYSGDGGPAGTAKMDLPSSSVEDSLGNIYISDQANFRIRKVEVATGNIITIAGTGVAGYTGDGGPATLALLRSPVGQSAPPAGRIDIDAQDRIYIADTGNHCIRRIETDGTIVTLAGTGSPGYTGDGGPATKAQLNTPSDVAVAPDGAIYIADTKNNVVRRVDPDGSIKTVAGTGSGGFSGDGRLGSNAKLNRPYGVAVAPNGDVVIADTHNHRFRILTEEPREADPGEEPPDIVIVPCTNTIGSICTYAGTGFPGLNGDGLDRQKTHLYQPIDMEFTPSGRVYVLDWNNHKVRQLLPDQTFRTVMGTDFVGDGPPDLSDLTVPGAPGLTIDLNHPTDMQEFPNGDLMVMNWHNHKIRVLYPDTGLVRVITGLGVGFVDNVIAKDARLNQPPHGVLDPSGNLFFVDQRNQRIRMITDYANLRENAMVSTIAGTGALGFNGDGPALSTQFSFPTGTNPEPSGGIARASDGTLYFSDTNNHRIRKITFTGGDFLTGQVTTIAGTGTAGFNGDGIAATAQINYPQDMEIGPDGKLYFADTDNHRVRRIDLGTGMIETVAGTGVRSYSGDGGPAVDATLNRPLGVAFDPYGNLYISDTFNNRIRKVKLTSTPEGPASILPSDYLATYVEVRDCRFSLEHGGVYIRVLTNPEAAQQYQDEVESLPVGTVVVKEEFSDAACEQDEIVRYRAMRKEAPGFDSEDGDWHWQFLTPRLEVAEDTKDTCITCHRQADCVRRDYMCTLPGSSAGLRTILDSLPASLLSVSGGTPDDGHSHGGSINFDIFAVGADPRDGRGPLVVHRDHDAEKWERLSTGARGDLWWITDREVDGAFYMCGEDGLILKYFTEAQTFRRMTTPGGKLLYGVWGVDEQSLYAVGGDLADEDAGGAVWKYNVEQEEWVVDQGALDARPGGLPTLYKIWGTSPTDIWAVGRRGTILNYNGVRWVDIPTGVIRPLFTVHGDAQRVMAVGGAFDGVILELDGSNFIDRVPADAPQMNGIFVSSAGGPATAVGDGGVYAIRGATEWELQPAVTAAQPFDFHATWVDSAGGVWAVGGDIKGEFEYGVLAYGGSSAVSPEFIADPCSTGIESQAGTVSYTRDIVPMFKRAGCMNSECHGPLFESEYDLRTYEGFFGPGLDARNHAMCNIVPGNPESSYLLEKLLPNPRNGEQMPNGLNPLSASEIQMVTTWILEGAVKDRETEFTRGDINNDQDYNITDPVAVLNYLFIGGATPSCLDAVDVNDDGELNITDGVFSLNFLFLGGPQPSVPYPGCSTDPTEDELQCETYTACQ